MIPGDDTAKETGFGHFPTKFTSPEIFRSIREKLFRNLLPNTLGRGDADTSWAYSGMGAGLSKSAFGATTSECYSTSLNSSKKAPIWYHCSCLELFFALFPVSAGSKTLFFAFLAVQIVSIQIFRFFN